MKKQFQYIIVDDDPANNLICEFVIGKSDPGASVRSFEDPEKALLAILKTYSETVREVSTILFLDINMPTMNGWEFLENFREFHQNIRGQFCIYILSSSIEDFTEQKQRFPFVRDFLSKPLTKEKIKHILTRIPA